MAPKIRSKKNKQRASTSNVQREEEVPVQPEPSGPYALLMPANLHPWLQFNQRGPNYNEYCERFLKLREKQFICPRNPDWGPLDQAGIGDNVRGVLTSRYYLENGHIDYDDWTRLFGMWHPIYKELCLEFLSTVRIRENGITNANDRTFMTCHLGGEVRQLSYTDLAICFRLYTAETVQAGHFNDFMMAGARIKSCSSSSWEQLSDVTYATSGNHVTDIKDVNLRVIQRFLSHSLTQRDENTERVNLQDMWYLEKMDDNNLVNIPYGVAWFLVKKAGGRKVQSPICGGHFITAIARYYGINFAGLTVVNDPRIPVGAPMYIKAYAIVQAGASFVPWAAEAGSPPHQRQRTEEEPSTSHHSHGHEQYHGAYSGGHAGPSYAEQEYMYPALPTTLDLMQEFQRMQLQQEQAGYRIGAIEYQSAWHAHNQELFHSNPSSYQPIPYRHIPEWGTPEASSPPPIYNRETALEEAQRHHQEQYQHRLREQLYHDDQRQQEERGSWFDFMR